jgi:transcriptional regulator with XRE-family HTH domain
MSERAQSEIGRRVAELRKLRGLTQAGLAARLHRSESWVTKIERGARGLDSVTVLTELAEALAVPVEQLAGGQTGRPGERPGQGGAALTELQRVLDRPSITSLDASEVRSVAEIARGAEALRRMYETFRHNFSTVLPRLPVLLGEAKSVARTAPAPDRPRAYAALVSLYRLTAMEFYHWGDLTRARVAVD